MSTVDVLIIGGGPGGATAATLLARAGHSVRVLERERFPRFRIGESLLPAEIPIFERLGFEPPAGATVRKLGAEFLDEATGDRAVYWFADGLPGTLGHAVHVERAPFDEALVDLARRTGADVRQGERALEVDIGGDGVEVRTETGSHRARYLVDATGQDALLARRHRSVEPTKGFGIAAVYAHFHDVRPEVIEALAEGGNHIQILLVEAGWCWVIPLGGGKLSIGVVSARKGLGADDLDRALARSERLTWLTTGATAGAPRLVGNFSYTNREPAGARYACVGDAAAFLDPVFSSGVALAMISAERMADLLSPALAEDREAAPDLMAPLKAHMDRAYTTFGNLIHSFYHTKIVQHLFFHPDPDPELRAGLITVLAGDVWREDNRFQNMLLSSTRRQRRG